MSESPPDGGVNQLAVAAQQTDSLLLASVAARLPPWSVVSLKSLQTCECLSAEELQSALTDVKTTLGNLPLAQAGISQFI